jgi:uncharacterized membrane protein
MDDTLAKIIRKAQKISLSLSHHKTGSGSCDIALQTRLWESSSLRNSLSSNYCRFEWLSQGVLSLPVSMWVPFLPVILYEVAMQLYFQNRGPVGSGIAPIPKLRVTCVDQRSH